MLVLSRSEVRRSLLNFVGANTAHISSLEVAEAKIREHYGLDSVSAINLFRDICGITGNLRLLDAEKSMLGFLELCVVLYGLHSNPPFYMMKLLRKRLFPTPRIWFQRIAVVNSTLAAPMLQFDALFFLFPDEEDIIPGLVSREGMLVDESPIDVDDFVFI